MAWHGTDTYQGMALACLYAADRHHQLAVEILPALRDGHIVVCDRYVASSLVLQALDGLSSETVWQLNHGVYRPDLAIILNSDPPVINARLRGRGGHSRFERAEDNNDLESGLYLHAEHDLHAKGWGSRLRDHSGLAVRVSLEAATTLLTSDPTTAASAQTESEPILF